MALNNNESLEQEINIAVSNNDVDFFIRLITDNNPEEVKANLIHEGYSLPSNPTVSDLYDTLKVIEANEGQEKVGQLLSVAYLDTGASWTLGARDYIANYGRSGDMLLSVDGEETEGRNIWGQIGQGLGQFGMGLLGGFFGGSTSQQGSGGSGGSGQPEDDGKILGMKKENFWLVLGLSVVVIVGGILLFRRKSTRI